MDDLRQRDPVAADRKEREKAERAREVEEAIARDGIVGLPPSSRDSAHNLERLRVRLTVHRCALP